MKQLECIYHFELKQNTKEFEIIGDEAKHLKALRLNPADKILVTNGKGLMAECVISHITGKNYTLFANKFMDNYGELSMDFGLAIGIIDNRDRMEFALEKGIELGITDFMPLITDFTQKKNVNSERLQQKAIAAMKQCKRSVLPKIHKTQELKKFLENQDKYEKVFIADIDGTRPDLSNDKEPAMLFVGPEGGFSEREMKMLREDKRCSFIKLSSRRLRTETAAIAGLAVLSPDLNEK